MRKGPALYYATDKNVFDALNQSKVDQDTIQAMFRRRNMACSKQTAREQLSLFFSRLTHDYLDHRDLSARLGVVSRRERFTAVDLKGSIGKDVVTKAVDALKDQLSKEGDAVHVSVDGSSTVLYFRYSTVDFKKSEFSQLQQREGRVEVIQDKEGLVVRSTKAERVDAARDEFIRLLETEAKKPLDRSEISLFHHKSHSVRSKFFYDLMTDLPGYVRRDVTDVFVYKASPTVADSDSDEESASEDSHIERVLLRGKGVSQSDLLRELIQEKSYYIAKMGWLATEKFGKGSGFDIEVTFADPENCTGFAYILRAVRELGDDGKLVKHRRNPTTSEIDSVAKAIESKARELVKKLAENKE